MTKSSTGPVRVLHVINDLSVGGAEMMLYKLLSHGDSRGFRHAVVSLGRRSTLDAGIEALGVPVYDIGMRPSKLPTPGQLRRLLSAVRHFKPDVIQGWMYHGCLAAELSRAAAARGARVVWSVHSCNNDLTREKRMTAAIIRLCGRLSSRPSKIIYVSEASRRQHEAMGYRPENAVVIPNGFDTTRFAPSTEARAAVRAELGVREDHLLIGLVGRFHPMKDHINFLRAASLLSEDCHAARFLLVGREVDADNPVLRRLVVRWGLEDRAHLLGERSDIPRLIAASDICSLSSSYGESFPLVVGEAMACGVPCVVTDVGDAARLVGPTGLVVPPRDSEALADAWRELIRLGSDGRAQLGEAARERVRENFQLAAVTAQYEALFRSVLQR
ncbi:MAG TPA: glycosyltransferase [Pyrinomonadaceae bacterium]|nr:glycosyltransferase [Pyrinomonadaceae bacterium]